MFIFFSRRALCVLQAAGRSFVVLAFGLTLLAASVRAQTDAPRVVMAVHGGAGTILPENMTDVQEAQYRAALEAALRAGYAVLDSGGTSVEAVIAAITPMEDSPLFNSGRGAVFTSERTVELDASLMDGRTHQAGAVTGVKRVKSPITLARRVMEASPHVMMMGEGAEAFAEEQGLEMVPNEYFYTVRRRQQIDAVLKDEAAEREASSEQAPSDGAPSSGPMPSKEQKSGGPRAAMPLQKKFGTVGAVALDREGDLAAGTSTGGMTNKRFGRIGDSPIIGAGTYADNETVAVSSTGHGEYFIRYVVAHDIAAMMRYAGADVETAARTVIMDKLTEHGGTGGVIALDADGHVALSFNTPGMYRGTIDEHGAVNIQIYGPDTE